jgi:hypothetical protein
MNRDQSIEFLNSVELFDDFEPQEIHELDDLALFGFGRGFETADRGRVRADATLSEFLNSAEYPWMSA